MPVVAAVETPAASDLCTDAPEGAPPRRGTQRRTRYRRMTTVSSTSSFRRRRRRRGRLLGVKPQAEAPHSAPVASRGAMRRRHRRRTCRARVHSAPSIRAAACARARGIRPWSAAVRARTGPAWSPSSSPPQRERVKARGERSASVDGKWGDCCEQICRPRAQQASVGRCTGTSWPDLGVRAHLLRGARASRRAAKGACRSMASGEIVLRRAWSRPQRGGGARARAEAKEAWTNGFE